jgi:hypothetical protein
MNFSFSLGTYDNSVSLYAPVWTFFYGAGITINSSSALYMGKDTIKASNGTPGDITNNTGGIFQVVSGGDVGSDLALENVGGDVYLDASYHATTLFSVGGVSGRGYYMSSGLTELNDGVSLDVAPPGSTGTVEIDGGLFELKDGHNTTSTIDGYFDMSGGTLDLQCSSGSTYFQGTLNVTDDFTQSGGTLKIDYWYGNPGGGQTTKSSLVAVTGHATISGSTLSPQVVSGSSGTFTWVNFLTSSGLTGSYSHLGSPWQQRTSGNNLQVEN